MNPSTLRLRVLAAIGASGLAVLSVEACGSSSSTPAEHLDASAEGGGEAASEGSAVDSPSETGEAGLDAATDVAPDRLSARRPLLAGASLRRASLVPREDWIAECAEAPPSDVDARTLGALAKAYALDGCEEHASVAAFARLTLHLLSAGAPPELVEIAHRASLDEIRHARTCFALARRYGGAPLGPGPLNLEGLFSGGHAAPGATLPEIAALCAEEGCVGETLGVLLASEALARARDPFVREVLSRMLDEEASHVELAWRVVSWCVRQSREPVRRAVAQAIRRGVAATRAIEVRRYDGIDLAAWNAHGRVTCEQARAAAERGILEVIEPCARVLLAREPDADARMAHPARRPMLKMP
jgi:hypothetical protein